MTKRRVGRPIGAKQKIDTETRNSIARFIHNKFEAKNIEKLYNQTLAENGAKDAVNVLLLLAEYVLPKLQRIEHTGKDGSELSIEHVLNTLGQSTGSLALPDIDNNDIIEARLINEDIKNGE